MALAVVETETRLPYQPADLCKLVGDVRAYPRFIPWLKSIRVVEEKRIGEGWEGLAEAEVGWRAIAETFATHVRCSPEEGAVEVKLARGPFRRLENRWRFEHAPQGARIKFWIAYEFKNPLLQALAAANRDHAARRILSAFEAEAHRRFGASAPNPSSGE